METVSGPVTFDGTLDANGRYKFETHSASIRVTVPAGTGFDLEAQSFSGSFASNAMIALGQGNQTIELTEPEIHWGMTRYGTREKAPLAAAVVSNCRPSAAT